MRRTCQAPVMVTATCRRGPCESPPAPDLDRSWATGVYAATGAVVVAADEPAHTGELDRPRYDGTTRPIPSFFILLCSVDGLSPRISAAPPGP